MDANLLPLALAQQQDLILKPALGYQSTAVAAGSLPYRHG